MKERQKILNKIKKKLNVEKDSQVAQALNVTPQAIYNWKVLDDPDDIHSRIIKALL